MREHKSMKEGFTVGNPMDDAQPNIWPSESLLPGFRTDMEAFFEVNDFLNLVSRFLAGLTCSCLGLQETSPPPLGLSVPCLEAAT